MTWEDFPNLTRPGRIDYIKMQDGIRLRTASWPSVEDSKGIIILVNGHREYMEKQYEFISDFLGRGFAVYSFDNRGQGLSDRSLSNRLKSYTDSFDYFPRDLNEFITGKVMKDPRAQELPKFLIGHSMGGHICLRYLGEYPGIIDKAIIMSPMIGINLGSNLKARVTKLLIRLAKRLGFGKNYALGEGSSFSKKRHLMRFDLITHDMTRYAEEESMVQSHPDLYVGGATYGWLDAALDSIRKIHQPGFIDKITIPLLAILAGAEKLVDNQASRELLSGHDNITIITIDDARHEMYRESNLYRNKLWQAIDKFLAVK